MRLTAEEWEAIQEHYHFRCVYCGQKSPRLTIDHITPQSHGGLTSRGNIVPACQSCNSRKGNRVPLRTIQPLLDEPYDGVDNHPKSIKLSETARRLLQKMAEHFNTTQTEVMERAIKYLAKQRGVD